MNSMYLLDFVGKSRYCGSISALNSAFHHEMVDIGFERWAYTTAPSGRDQSNSPTIIHNYPNEWVLCYQEKGYSNIDPVITLGQSEYKPFIWSSLYEGDKLSNLQRSYLGEAHDFDLIDGVGVPIYGLDRDYSMLSIATGRSAETAGKALRYYKDRIVGISYVYHCLSQKYMEEILQEQSLPDRLTTRERECLLWVAKGKSSWEIAKIIKTSERTVIFHIENAKRKLGVTSRSHAAVKAITAGLISP